MDKLAKAEMEALEAKVRARLADPSIAEKEIRDFGATKAARDGYARFKAEGGHLGPFGWTFKRWCLARVMGHGSL